MDIGGSFCQRGVPLCLGWVHGGHVQTLIPSSRKHFKAFKNKPKKKYAPTQRVDDTHGEMQYSTDFITELPWKTIEFPGGEAKMPEVKVAYTNDVDG